MMKKTLHSSAELKALCVLHRAHYRQWRGHRFDPVSGDRWPGTAHVFFNAGCGSSNMGAMRETVAREWQQKNDALLCDIIASCQRRSGCAPTPDILEWCTSGARMWRADADGMRFLVDGTCSAAYPDAGNGAGYVLMSVTTDDRHEDALRISRHASVRAARVAAHDYWRQTLLSVLGSAVPKMLRERAKDYPETGDNFTDLAEELEVDHG
jgi:hypothetical protein